MSHSLIVYPAAFPTYFYLVCVETNGWFFYLTHYVMIHLARASTHNFCQALCSLPVVVQEYRRVFHFESYDSECGYIYLFVVFITTEVLFSSTPGMCIISFLLVT